MVETLTFGNPLLEDFSALCRGFIFTSPWRSIATQGCYTTIATPATDGDALNGDRANCDGRYPFGTQAAGPFVDRPTRVGAYEAAAGHPWRLCDVIGNVAEWCENEYPAGHRAVRGGSWLGYPVVCRAAYRNYHTPDFCDSSVGFRLLLPRD